MYDNSVLLCPQDENKRHGKHNNSGAWSNFGSPEDSRRNQTINSRILSTGMPNRDRIWSMRLISGKYWSNTGRSSGGCVIYVWQPLHSWQPKPRGLMATPEISNRKANLALNGPPILHVEFAVMHGDPKMWRLKPGVVTFLSPVFYIKAAS